MSNVYESPKLLSEYLVFHYGADDDLLPYDFGPKDALRFPVRTVQQGVDQEILPEEPRALDLGCAVGRSSFELARFCSAVVGIDFSESFISAAKQLQTKGELQFDIQEEGVRSKSIAARLPEGIDKSRVSFEVGDALELRTDLGSFDVVHAANLLCRLKDPAALLKRLPSMVRTGGQVVLSTPCTWLEEFTPAEHWLGGSPGLPERTTLEAIAEVLKPGFQQAWVAEMPMLIRETARKFQWTVVQTSRWIRL